MLFCIQSQHFFPFWRAIPKGGWTKPLQFFGEKSLLGAVCYGIAPRWKSRKIMWTATARVKWPLPFAGRSGFHLLPRLKALHAQKLYRPETGRPDAYLNLQPVLTRPIDWDLIARQYDEMVKYATAPRLGTAEPEDILRRFTRNNVRQPTYKALAELGKARKTTFLCRYLHWAQCGRELEQCQRLHSLWPGRRDRYQSRRGSRDYCASTAPSTS
jgi:hypothetical protein